jgi:S-adenosylmethionine decarboxylase
MLDLAPEIHRQRLVVEGLCTTPIDAAAIRSYVTHRSPLYGWAGWIHWETSGAHFYAWETPRLFFSVDVYSCKPFAAADVVSLTERFFASPTVVAREF